MARWWSADGAGFDVFASITIAVELQQAVRGGLRGDRRHRPARRPQAVGTRGNERYRSCCTAGPRGEMQTLGGGRHGDESRLARGWQTRWAAGVTPPGPRTLASGGRAAPATCSGGRARPPLRYRRLFRYGRVGVRVRTARRRGRRCCPSSRRSGSAVEWQRPSWAVCWRAAQPGGVDRPGGRALGTSRVGAPLPFEDLRFHRPRGGRVRRGWRGGARSRQLRRSPTSRCACSTRPSAHAQFRDPAPPVRYPATGWRRSNRARPPDPKACAGLSNGRRSPVQELPAPTGRPAACGAAHRARRRGRRRS